MQDCFVKDICHLYREDTCPYENDFCMRQYKIDYLLDQALLSDAQKQRRALLLDVNKKDLKAFSLFNTICRQQFILSQTSCARQQSERRFQKFEI